MRATPKPQQALYLLQEMQIRGMRSKTSMHSRVLYWKPLGYTAVSYFEQCKASVQSEWAMVLACVRYK